MKLCIHISLLILTSLNLHATVTVPGSATARPPVIVLTGNELQLITKLKNQVKSYLDTKNVANLDTLGNFIQKELLNALKALDASLTNEITKAQTTDVTQSAQSHPERDFDYLRLFFNTIDDTLEPLLKTYTNHSSNRALIKQQNAKQKSNILFNQEEEYYALQRNIFIPFDDYKRLINKATRTVVSKLLDRVYL